MQGGNNNDPRTCSKGSRARSRRPSHEESLFGNNEDGSTTLV